VKVTAAVECRLVVVERTRLTGQNSTVVVSGLPRRPLENVPVSERPDQKHQTNIHRFRNTFGITSKIVRVLRTKQACQECGPRETTTVLSFPIGNAGERFFRVFAFFGAG